MNITQDMNNIQKRYGTVTEVIDKTAHDLKIDCTFDFIKLAEELSEANTVLLQYLTPRAENVYNDIHLEIGDILARLEILYEKNALSKEVIEHRKNIKYLQIKHKQLKKGD